MILPNLSKIYGTSASRVYPRIFWSKNVVCRYTVFEYLILSYNRLSQDATMYWQTWLAHPILQTFLLTRTLANICKSKKIENRERLSSIFINYKLYGKAWRQGEVEGWMPWGCVPVYLLVYFCGFIPPLDDASLGQCVPWTMRPWPMCPDIDNNNSHSQLPWVAPMKIPKVTHVAASSCSVMIIHHLQGSGRIVQGTYNIR